MSTNVEASLLTSHLYDLTAPSTQDPRKQSRQRSSAIEARITHRQQRNTAHSSESMAVFSVKVFSVALLWTSSCHLHWQLRGGRPQQLLRQLCCGLCHRLRFVLRQPLRQQLHRAASVWQLQVGASSWTSMASSAASSTAWP